MNRVMTVLLLSVYATAAEQRAEFLVMAGGQAESAGWSADGKILATVNHDGTIKLWNESGELLRTLGGHASGTVMAWKPGSHLLTSGGDDAAIRFWDADKGVLAGEFAAGHQVQGLAWSSDGGLLASNGEGYFKVWEAKSRKLLRTFGQSGNTEYINAVAWRPGGKEIVSVAGTGFVKTWNTDTGAVVRRFLIATRTERKHVFLGGFSPDGKKLVTGSDNLILLWDAEANRRAAPLWRVVREHYDIAGLAWSPDGRRILSCDGETHARMWRVEDGKETPGPGVHKQPVRSVAWRPDGRQLATISFDGEVRIWKDSGEAVRTLPGPIPEVRAVASTRDGTIAAGYGDGSIRLWGAGGGLQRVYPAHESIIAALAWSPDGEWLASGGKDRMVKLWRRTGEAVRTLVGHEDWVVALAWSPNGDRLASAGSDDRTMRVWERKTGREVRPAERGLPVFSVAWSPDGKYLAQSAGHLTVQMAETGRYFQKFGESSKVAWSPEGKRLASVTPEGVLSISEWPPVSRPNGIDLELQGKTCGTKRIGYPEAVAWSPDGRMVAASDRGVVQICSAEAAELRVLAGHPAGSLAWQADSRTLAVGGRDGIVRLWDATRGIVEAEMVAFGDGEWVTLRPGKMEHTGSAHGAERVRIVTGGGEAVPLAGFAGTKK